MASVNLLDENLQLWNKFRNGNADAFGELMQTHYRDLFNYGTRFSKDTDLVRACIQHLFLAVWINRLTISESSFFKYYLLKSLRHQLVTSFTPTRRNSEPQFEYFFNNSPSAESRFTDGEYRALARKIRKTLAGLSRRQQEILYLRFHLEADTGEIAEIMSLSHPSINNLLQDALRRLHKVTPKKAFWFPHLLSI